MKKLITMLTGLCLVVFFLIYSGFFRDDKDPVEVTRYFFQCIEKGDTPPVFQVTKFEYYQAGHRVRSLTDEWFKGKRVNATEFELLAAESDLARVRVKIIYEDKNAAENVTTLERNYHGNWVVSNVEFCPA